MDQKLLQKLTVLRETIKAETKKGERIPPVCSDEALYEIARLQPRRVSELPYISGLGSVFAEKYGDRFISVILEHTKRENLNGVIAKETLTTLKNLELRLTNVNRRNRLLYTGKLSAKTAVDLVGGDGVEAAEKLAALLLDNGGRTLTIAKREEDERRYRQICTLLREVQRQQRESGEYELFIAYPYAEGKLSEDFPVRAPLLFFPVEVKREIDRVTLKLDKTKDILYNGNLILLANRATNKPLELPSNVAENVTKEGYISDCIDYYAGGGITVLPPGGELTPERFEDKTVGDFKKIDIGKFTLRGNIVLGKFSQYSSAIQRDFKHMLDCREINFAVKDLLEGADGLNIYDEQTTRQARTGFNELDSLYVNELNASQENAVASLKTHDELVVQGPPGTGKSQTIIGMIADFAARGKSILLVSQKKAALDVVYSRLGELSRYALLISDAEDKNFFYTQMEELTEPPKKNAVSEEKLRLVSEEIAASERAFSDIAVRLFQKERYGESMSRIYRDNTQNRFLKDSSALQKYFERLPKELLNLPYDKIRQLRIRAEDETAAENAFAYFALLEAFPFLNKTRADIDEFSYISLMQNVSAYVDEQHEYQSQNVFKRLFAKGRRKKRLNILLKQFLHGRADGALKKRLFQKPQQLADGLARYFEFLKVKAATESLSDEEQLYEKAMYHAYCLGAERETLAGGVYDCIVRYIISLFETENRDVFAKTENFPRTVENVNALMNEKRGLSREKLRASLLLGTEDLRMAKRAGEIRRAIESKRRQSVAKFVRKFRFELLRGVKVFLMTPESVSELLPLENGLFDLVIFDEASQVYIEKGIPAIARAKKVVIAGDHKQLRPSSLGMGRIDYAAEEEEDAGEEAELGAALEEESLLDLARFKYDEVMLSYHYRARYEELIAFSNYAFYGGKLRVSPNSTLPSEPPIEVIKVENAVWTKRANLAEAERVVELVKRRLTENSGETFGVITFNISQRDLIADLLDEEGERDPLFLKRYTEECDRKENGEDIGFFVKNIENVQGDERDCIIFSLGYAKGENGKVVRNFGWLNQRGGENRLNVAISRAKKKIYLVTSVTPEELKSDDLENRGPKLLQKYLQYSLAVSRGDTEGAGVILNSLCEKAFLENATGEAFADEVANRLTSIGYAVDRNVGIGSYRVDIAIRDHGGYVLGIECDTELYENVPSLRERDIHRQKYFESRGWKMYRLWSHNWWRDSKREIEKINKILAR